MTDDRDLRRRFDALRASDAEPPAFDDVLTRARSRAASPSLSHSRHWQRAAALVVLAVGTSWLALRVNQREPSRGEPVITTSLSTWRSPTAFLLAGPGDALLRTLPAISPVPPELRPPGDTTHNHPRGS